MVKKRKTKSNKKLIGGIVTALCIIGIVLMFALGSEGDFISNLQQIWTNTIDGAGEWQPVDRDAQSLAALESNGDKLIIYAIDTGNSDCILVRTPEGHSMLVDAADSDDIRNISGTLQALEIEKLDAAVATHPDADHIGSMGKVVAEFTPSVIYMPNFEKDTSAYTSMINAIQENNVEQVLVTAPYEFTLGSLHALALNPQPREYESANDASIVLLLTYGQNKVLLTGDIETEALADIMANYPDLLDVDVLKIAHHGSARSTTQDFLDATTPDIAIINAGEGNDYGHPHRETTALLNENQIVTLRTDQDGDIAIFIDKTDISYAIENAA